MSSTINPAMLDAPDASAKTHAMLVRGRVYVLVDTVYEAGIPAPVTPENMRWLKKHAIDALHVEGEQEFQRRHKFKYLTSAEAEVQRLKNVAEGMVDEAMPDLEEDEDEVTAPAVGRGRGRPSHRGNS